MRRNFKGTMGNNPEMNSSNPGVLSFPKEIKSQNWKCRKNQIFKN